MKKVVFFIACVALLAVGCGRVSNPTPQPVACSQEARLCPDGSYVSRTGPECQFAACPSGAVTSTPPAPVVPPVTVKSGGISGYIHMGPTCPVERIPPDPNCADRPYANAAVSAIGSSGKQYQTQSDSVGKFNLSVPADSYAVKVSSPNSLPRCPDQTATVIANNTATLDISCDTGIR